MSSDLREIVDRLPHLSAGELDQLFERIKALRQMGGNGNGHAKSDDSDVILDTIIRVMQSNGLTCPYLKQLRQRRNYTSFKEKVPALMDYLKKVSTNRLEQSVILDLGVGLLYHDIKHWSIPMTDSLIMNNIHRIPAIMDVHFPGYARSGMLKMLVKR
jgi:hypothetical protein